MVAKNSESYPYLAIAQHHQVPYREVLAYVEHIPSATLQRSQPWQLAAWEAWERLQARLSR